MDLNQLLYHHQIALMQGGSSSSRGKSLVDHYARKIRELRGDMGLPNYTGWPESKVPS